MESQVQLNEGMPIPRPLKRSASSASLASMTLPTPPRTRRRRNGKRGLPRGSRRSDDSASGEDLPDSDDETSHKNKRRRLSEPAEDDVNEKDDNSPAAHLFQATILPFSPPCSKRQTRSTTRTAPSTAGSSMASPPATPSATSVLLPGFNPQPKGKPKVNLLPIAVREKTKALQPTRDEEENPFLDSDEEKADDDEDPFIEKPTKKAKATLAMIDEEQESKDWVEPPTIGYVFRGVRAEFANPLWAPPLPQSPNSPSPSISSTSTSFSHDPRDPSSAAIHLLSSSSAGPSRRKSQPKPKKAAPKPTSPRTTRARAQLAALAEAKARSELPLEHPEYEADIACKPKLLFGVRPKRGLKPKAADKGKEKLEKVATTSSEWS